MESHPCTIRTCKGFRMISLRKTYRGEGSLQLKLGSRYFITSLPLHFTSLFGLFSVFQTLLMQDATQAAPNPLSIFTTVTFDAQLFSIPSSAATPPKLAP
jgi:hypothetical protein